jgi:hypothetical protein
MRRTMATISDRRPTEMRRGPLAPAGGPSSWRLAPCRYCVLEQAGRFGNFNRQAGATEARPLAPSPYRSKAGRCRCLSRAPAKAGAQGFKRCQPLFCLALDSCLRRNTGVSGRPLHLSQAAREGWGPAMMLAEVQPTLRRRSGSAGTAIYPALPRPLRSRPRRTLRLPPRIERSQAQSVIWIGRINPAAS